MGPITFQRPEFAGAEQKWNQRFSQNDQILPTCATGGSIEETKS
jgi:hypothetical protein